MAASIVTIEDLQNLKQDLLVEFQKILSQRPGTLNKKWLKSYDLMKLLGVSHGTIQNFRDSGMLPFTKIGGVIFYDIDDVQKMIQDNKSNRDFPSRKKNPWRKV